MKTAQAFKHLRCQAKSMPTDLAQRILTVETKVCKTCQKEKPVSEYYLNKSNRKPMAVCKLCHKNRTARPSGEKWQPKNVRETYVITWLRNKGIYASPGKVSEYTWVDVVAWGCIRVEVKYGEFNGRTYLFRFTQSQVEEGVRADVIALVVGEEVYIFRADHPYFYDNDNRLRPAVVYTPFPLSSMLNCHLKNTTITRN